jgi:hypothetical protein
MYTLHCLPPSATDGPSPMQLTGACRLCGSSSPCSCCPCLVQFHRVCLTAQKPTIRTYQIEQTLPQYSISTSRSAFVASPPALHCTDITHTATPCSFFVQPSSATYHCISYALDFTLPHLASLCTIPRYTTLPLATLALCCGTPTNPLLPLTHPFTKTHPKVPPW